MTSQTALRLHGLSVSIGCAEILTGVDLAVQSGEVLAIVGPSGCGKTTLLRTIAGLVPLSGGGLHIAGVAESNVPPSARGVQVAFQTPVLYPFLTVEENLRFPPKRPYRSAWRDEVVDVFEIQDLLSRRPSGLSGGEVQRVALARTVLREATLYLLDEPLSDVDPLLARRIRQYVCSGLVRSGSAVIYVTHDQEEAWDSADRVAVLRSGTVHQCDVPEVLFERPETLFVSQFIGDPGCFVLSGTLQCGEEGTTVSLDGGQTLIRVQTDAGPGDVRVAFRRISVVDDASSVHFMGSLLEIEQKFGRAIATIEVQGMSQRVLLVGMRQLESSEFERQATGFRIEDPIVTLFSARHDSKIGVAQIP